MTDLRDQLARLLDDEPDSAYDVDHVVRIGRRARRRHNAMLATAGTVGAAGLTAAVVIPVAASGGHEASVQLGTRPTPTASATTGKCYLIAAPPSAAKRDIARLIHSGRVGANVSVKEIRSGKHGGRSLLEVCPQGTAPQNPKEGMTGPSPAGPPYHYTEDPQVIASRLGAHLHDRVTSFGLTITYTRPFSQESTTPDRGHPSYFGGNVDVHEANGYADIGVQVTHETTESVPFTGDCTGHCQESKLPDGSVLRTDQVKAGRGDTILTAEVHRNDGTVVQAQESDYPFGPDAGSQPHGDMPLTLDQLVSLAEDSAFTF